MAAKIIKISCDQSCSMQKQFLRRPLENGESENNNEDLAENPHGNPGPSYCGKTSGSCSVHACEARHLSPNGDELRVTRALCKRGVAAVPAGWTGCCLKAEREERPWDRTRARARGRDDEGDSAGGRAVLTGNAEHCRDRARLTTACVQLAWSIKTH